MSAFWVKISTILCLCYTAEMKEIVWREVGETVTIQCRSSSGPRSLHLIKGMREEQTIAKILKPKTGRQRPSNLVLEDRVEYNGTFPNINFYFKNLNVNDTGPYWCSYQKTDIRYNLQTTKGEGCVILLVTENDCARVEAVHGFDEPKLNMPVVYAVPAAALLFVIISGFVIWIKCRTKSTDITVEQTCVATGTIVYEDKGHVEAEEEAEEEAEGEAVSL